jgi:outer membrane protein assembly factor BamA
MRKPLILLLSLTLAMHDVYGQDSIQINRIKALPVPTLGYTPETNFYFGAVTLFTLNVYQDSQTRISNASLEFNYTQRKQSILDLTWNYFFREEMWYTEGILHRSYYPDFYYGIGAQTRQEDEVQFSSSRFDVQIDGFRKIQGKTFVGLGMRSARYWNVDGDGIARHSELKSSEVRSLRLAFLHDSRNRILTPSGGLYFRLNASYNFSENRYPKFELDLRKYHEFRKGFILAGRYYQAWVGQNTPFFDYAIMGGDQTVRGYFYGRFRDNRLSTFQAELRTPQIYRMGFALLGGLSTLSSFEKSSAIALFPNYGIGFRVLVDKAEKTNLRLDYAFGSRNQTGFYIAFGESF